MALPLHSRLLPLLLAFALHLAKADVIDDFNDGDDAGWTQVSPLAPFGAGGTFSFPGGAYRIEAPASPAPGSVGPARAGALRLDQTYTDFDFSADILNLNLLGDQNTVGLLARVSDLGLGTTDGYLFNYKTNGRLGIQRIVNEVDTIIQEIDLTLNPAGSYRFHFTGQGSALAASVYDLAAPTVPLATLSGVDGTYASGNLGLLVFDDSPAGDRVAAGTFDNVMITVPEPSSLVLLAGGLLVACRRRR